MYSGYLRPTWNTTNSMKIYFSGYVPPTWNTTNSVKIYVFWVSTPYVGYYGFYEHLCILAIYSLRGILRIPRKSIYSGYVSPTWNTTNSQEIYIFWLSTPYVEYYESYEIYVFWRSTPYVEYYEFYENLCILAIYPLRGIVRIL